VIIVANSVHLADSSNPILRGVTDRTVEVAPTPNVMRALENALHVHRARAATLLWIRVEMAANFDRVVDASAHELHALVTRSALHDVVDDVVAHVHELEAGLGRTRKHLDLLVGAEDVFVPEVAGLLQVFLHAELDFIRFAFRVPMHAIEAGLLAAVPFGDHAE